MSESAGWIGFDLDGTLARYDGWTHAHDIGEPVPAMVAILKAHVEEGVEVRIFTARVSVQNEIERKEIERTVQLWCLEHIGLALPVTNVKDFNCWAIYDDRAIAVEKNTGRILGGEVRR